MPYMSFHLNRYTPCEHDGIIERLGDYDNYETNYIYDPERVTVFIVKKVLKEDDVILDFDTVHDIEIGSMIEIDGIEYRVNHKKYQLDGTIDYYMEDKYVKCEDYEDDYKRVKSEASTYLLSKRELEDEHRKQTSEIKTDQKKSIWWYFGIR